MNIKYQKKKRKSFMIKGTLENKSGGLLLRDIRFYFLMDKYEMFVVELRLK